MLLPEDTYLERHDDLALGRGKRPFICLRQPAVQSPHDTRPAWRIAKELGTALGVGDTMVTPIDPTMSPVLTLAHSVSSILNEDFFIEPGWAFPARAGAVLLVLLRARLRRVVVRG